MSIWYGLGHSCVESCLQTLFDGSQLFQLSQLSRNAAEGQNGPTSVLVNCFIRSLLPTPLIAAQIKFTILSLTGYPGEHGIPSDHISYFLLRSTMSSRNLIAKSVNKRWFLSWSRTASKLIETTCHACSRPSFSQIKRNFSRHQSRRHMDRTNAPQMPRSTPPHIGILTN